MNQFTDDDLLDYFFGFSTPEQAEEIERRAREDPETARQLSIVRSISSHAQLPLVTPRKRFWQVLLGSLLRRRVVILAAILLLLCGASWGIWYVVVGPPLMSDNFNDEWFDSTRWHSARPGVREENGYLRLINRGSVVTREEFPGPIEVSFDWMWVDISSYPHYSDDLAIVLRTSGTHREQHAYEITDGVMVRFYTHDGRVKVEAPPLNALDESPKRSLRMPAGKWHRIRISDDGETVSVYITGPEIDGKYKEEPVLRVRCPGTYKSRRIAIYNRELVGEAVHESRIDNFESRKLKE